MFNVARNKLEIKKLKIKIFFNLQGWAKGALTLPLEKIVKKKIFTKNFLKKFNLRGKKSWQYPLLSKCIDKKSQRAIDKRQNWV